MNFTAPQEKSITFKLIDDAPGVGRAGQTVTMALSPQDTYITGEIETYLGGYAQQSDFRADQVSPPILVDKETGSYRNFTKVNTFKRVNVNTSLQGAINEVDPETELKSYTAEHRALGCFIPAITASQSVFDPMLAGAKRIREAMDLDREIRLWAVLTLAGNWAAANKVTLGAGFEWADPVGANSDPLGDLSRRRQGSAARITDWWMNQEIADAYIRHPAVRAHMLQMLGHNAPSPQIVAAAEDFAIPGVGNIHVVAAKVLNETTLNLDSILNDTIVGTHGIPGVPRTGEDMATVNTFRVKGPSGTGWQIRQVFLDVRGYAGGTMLIAGHQEAIVMASDSIGGVVYDVSQ